MAKKNNIRSMRFSDAMIEIIEAQAGETVYKCMFFAPEEIKDRVHAALETGNGRDYRIVRVEEDMGLYTFTLEANRA